jgi:uncharacterized protein YndB with AHSA1/START domain
MLRKLTIAFLVLVAAFALLVSSRPSQFHVERSQRIAAPPGVIFPLINDFHRWPSWSPWEHLDPGMKREYSGSPEGEGAAYDWSGNDDVGVGSMRITDSQPPTRVAIALEFKEPWQATNSTLFSVTPEASGSIVTWAMSGESNFVFKAIGLFMNMDEMVGKDFETGLLNLQRVAEVEAAKSPVGSDVPQGAVQQ